MLLNLRNIGFGVLTLSKKVFQSHDITFNETTMFFPGQEFTILAGNLQNNNEKVELEVSSYAPQGGDSVSHSSSKDHIEETNPNIHDTPSSEDHQTSDSYSIACNRPCRKYLKVLNLPLTLKPFPIPTLSTGSLRCKKKWRVYIRIRLENCVNFPRIIVP